MGWGGSRATHPYPSADGQAVEVTIRPGPGAAPGEGIARTAGALRDDAEWDAIMREIQRGR
jgi:hypothetical protein